MNFLRWVSLVFLISCSQHAFSNPLTDTTAINERGYYALVAGGSKGIGYSVAEALARRKYNLVLIARHEAALLKAKDSLERKYGVHVEVLVYDLSEANAAPAIAKWCTDRDLPLKMLCNIAGLGGANDYPALSLDSLRYMVNLNIESCMALSLLLKPLLEKNTPSYILNVSSMAGFAPIPAKNLYSATKSAVMFFSYSLRHQLKKEHISVSCLAPGPVFTKPSIAKETNEKLGWVGRQMAIPPERVGEIAVRKTLKKRALIVPGGMSKIMSGVVRFLPTRWAAGIYAGLG